MPSSTRRNGLQGTAAARGGSERRHLRQPSFPAFSAAAVLPPWLFSTQTTHRTSRTSSAPRDAEGRARSNRPPPTPEPKLHRCLGHVFAVRRPLGRSWTMNDKRHVVDLPLDICKRRRGNISRYAVASMNEITRPRCGQRVAAGLQSGRARFHTGLPDKTNGSFCCKLDRPTPLRSRRLRVARACTRVIIHVNLFVDPSDPSLSPGPHLMVSPFAPRINRSSEVGERMSA